MNLRERDVSFLPLQVVDGKTLFPQVALELGSKLVRHATAWFLHGPARWRTPPVLNKGSFYYRPPPWQAGDHVTVCVCVLLSREQIYWNAQVNHWIWLFVMKPRFSLDGVIIEGPRHRQAVKPLHCGDGWGDGVRRAKAVGPQVTWRQVTILLQPRLQRHRQTGERFKKTKQSEFKKQTWSNFLSTKQLLGTVR